MAFDEDLAERVRDHLARRRDITEKRMFGGPGFLLNGNPLVAVRRDSLLVRLGPEHGEGVLSRSGCRPTAERREGSRVVP